MRYSNPKIPEGINTSEESPLKEFAVLITGVVALVILLAVMLSFILDWATQYIPFSYEQALAKPFVEEFSNERGDIDNYLQDLANKITPLLSMPDDMVINVHYVDQSVVNGMATLGGNIFIYRGLLEKLPSENALVMLLAHEISHVKFRHPLKSLNKSIIINLLMVLIAGQSNSDISGLLSDTSLLTLLSFSRSQEQASDREAIVVTQALYQHTQGSTELFTVLKSSEQSTLPTVSLFNSHPDIEVRIKLIEKMVIENHWRSNGQITLIPKNIIEQINRKNLDDSEENK
ncbi:MAG: M48 family metallopeptidase [Colwellia sp.]